jgi:uncharacterized protein (TIGR02145 family)
MKKKTKILIFPLAIMGIILILASSCKKKDNEPTVFVPVLTTTAVTGITQIAAISGGNITDQGGAPVTARGVCWGMGPSPTIADNKTVDDAGTGTFSSNLTGLIPDTTYYVRAYATNSAGTAYGNVISFKTQQGVPGTIIDIDGNVYHTVTIGTQVWLKESLKVTHYRNGDPISHGKGNALFTSTTVDGAYWDYNNDPANSAVYGRLYNWFALANVSILAPNGFHVATYEEWTTLEDYLGGPGVAGGKLKEEGSAHWGNNNIATNETGFTALPAGIWESYSSTFVYMGDQNLIWTSTEISTNNAYAFVLVSSVPNLYHGEGLKYMGYSVRCLMDYVRPDAH